MELIKEGVVSLLINNKEGVMTMTNAELVEKMADDAGISKVAASMNSFDTCSILFFSSMLKSWVS